MIAEKRTITRIYAAVDGVLRHSPGRKGNDSYYDGAYAIYVAHDDGSSSRLYAPPTDPAVVASLYAGRAPRSSLWRANKTLLEKDRARLTWQEKHWRDADAEAKTAGK